MLDIVYDNLMCLSLLRGGWSFLQTGFFHMTIIASRSQPFEEICNTGVLTKGMHEWFSHSGIAWAGGAVHSVWTLDPPSQ